MGGLWFGELLVERSRPEAGIVDFLHKAFNQKDELAAHAQRVLAQTKAFGA
jgi:hypothetical protein